MELFSRLATRPVYNTRAVVLRTGVPADTFRAWERRYGIPSPVRTDGNQRLYSDRDVALIAWLRDQTRTGVTISQ
ncbi:MAG TPA: MerR family transcriptional regulator, partial [Thermomicrobiales bacterium]|nr:MerR family transcriptional regulator [Thermomicrobiales bacterium]